MWEYVPGMSRRTVREVVSDREHDVVPETGDGELTRFELGNKIMGLAYCRVVRRPPLIARCQRAVPV